MASGRGAARGFLRDDSRANFGVGDSCHVVGSEQSLRLSLSLFLSLALASPSSLCTTHLLLPGLRLSRTRLVDVAAARLLLHGLHLLVSAHTTSTPPTNLVPPTTPSTHPGLRPFSTQVSPSRTWSRHVLLKPETTRQLPGTAPWSIPPETYWWHVVQSSTKVPRSSPQLLSLPVSILPLHRVFCFCVCACVCVSWRLSA